MKKFLLIPLILLSLNGSAQSCDSLKKNYAKTIKYAIELEHEVCKRDSIIAVDTKIIAIQDTIIIQQGQTIGKQRKSLKTYKMGLFAALVGFMAALIY